ncbi:MULTISPECIES: hypothetical protein [unclassified Parafrankia]|nr:MULTISPECIES: hypothetical protein [unclassified Parafrankia]SQE00382.1 hypothetical protein FMEAI12_6500068 [Parafrankia sp. Ea1.12]
MTLFDAFRYDGRRVLVVGGATGITESFPNATATVKFLLSI